MKYSPFKYLLVLTLILLGNWNLLAQDELNRIDGQIEMTQESSVDSEQIIIKPLTKKVIVEAAVYQTVIEEVLVKEASSEFVVTPAVYQMVEEAIIIQEETSVIREISAIYETMTEQIMVAPESGEWVIRYYENPPSACYGWKNYVEGKGYPIARWEKIPAQYKTITKKVLKSPCGGYQTTLPPVYETIEKQILKVPEKLEEVKIPPEYEMLERQVLVIPAYEQTVFDFSVISPNVIEELGLAEPSTIITEIKPAHYRNQELLSPALIKVERPNLDQDNSTEVSFYEVSPAVYKTLEEKVSVQPESGKWSGRKPSTGPCFSQYPEDCDIVTWEKIPAIYKVIQKQILVSPTVFTAVEIPLEKKINK